MFSDPVIRAVSRCGVPGVQAIDLDEKLGRFTETWAPRIVAELNGQHVKVAKLDGEFVWHRHAREDELFLVLDGALDVHLRDGAGADPTAERVVRLGPGQMLVVPRGVEHKPVARPTASVLLFEPASTTNTGDRPDDPRTVAAPERI